MKMIPKMIHYCWFGGNPLDEKAIHCIESWRRFFPDYEIIRWDESNYDIHKHDFVQKAYNDRKWAFVSDVARLDVICQHGGIYFDTDVEVIKSYGDILEKSPVGFMGKDHQLYINTGLGFGAEKGHPLVKMLLDGYQHVDYDEYKQNLAAIACPILAKKILSENGIVSVEGIQKIMDITIYPHEYFNPLDHMTGKLLKTENTHSIHWYSDSWNSEENRKVKKRLQRFRSIFGEKYGEILFGIIESIRKNGLLAYILTHIKEKGPE